MFTRLSTLSTHTWRRISQTFFIFALNPALFSAKEICVPVLNCWACPWAAFGCPIGIIGHAASLWLVPFATLGILVVFGAAIGRLVCGWVCPFGFFQELVHKIPSKKLRFPKALRYLKYVILIVLVVAVPMAFRGTGKADGKFTGDDLFFCNICPAAALEVVIPLQLKSIIDPPESEEAETEAPKTDIAPPESSGESTGNTDGETGSNGEKKTVAEKKEPVPAWKSALLVFITSPKMWIFYGFLIMFVFFSRPFCRGFCPLGAIFAVFNYFSLYKMNVTDKCITCRECEKACPVDHDIYNSANSEACVRCLECKPVCPVEAIESGKEVE